MSTRRRTQRVALMTPSSAIARRLPCDAYDDRPHERGRRLEQFLNSLFALHDLGPRAAYNLQHQQIDGAFTFDTDDYLLEAAGGRPRCNPPMSTHFKAKVESKAKHTFGFSSP